MKSLIPFAKYMALCVAGAVPAMSAAQIVAPGGIVGRTIDSLSLPDLDSLPVGALTQRLQDIRLDRLEALVRESRGSVAFDDRRNPAVSGVLIVTGASAADVTTAGQAGFALMDRETIEGIDIDIVRLAVPKGQSLGNAIKALRTLLPAADISADNIYVQSGASAPQIAAGVQSSGRAVVRPAIGMIDGGVATHPAITSPVEAQGFTRGAPSASAHGTAIASLLIGSGSVRGAAPGKALLVADVYGTDPAGGNATAIARALGWFVRRGVPVATISLVGPANPLLGKAIASAQGKGLVIVAAVGNDGPAAPPAFPASYPGVIAVTGVDGRDRALPEAGRAQHLDYAAPGADMLAAVPGGKTVRVRGTSYAAPLVAARLVQHYPVADPARRAAAIRALDAEARDLGGKGADKTYGRGLICGICRTR
ncbi:S8 family serine peptidase [Sphingobium algorifonticola]|nr:S8 family serine peptidase [Sphingobium algorifonticola]